MRDLRSIRPTDESIDAEFSSQRRESVFQEVLDARSSVVSLGEHRRRWPAAAAAAVAAVAAAALVVQVLTPHGNSPVAEPPPVTQTVPSRSSYPATVSVAPPAAQWSAAEQLTGVAAAAAGGPAVASGAFLHVVRVEEQRGHVDPGSTDEPAAEDHSVTHDDYVDADGWLWSRRTGDQNLWLLVPQDADSISSLPTDPGDLDRELRSGTGNNSADERVFKAVHEILLTESASPELRAAAITVLQGIAENPQAPETTKEGDLATPLVSVTTVPLTGQQGMGYRASITDSTSRPGIENWLVLDPTGQIVESGSIAPTSTFTGTIVVREWVDALPADFVEVLGTDHVERDIDG